MLHVLEHLQEERTFFPCSFFAGMSGIEFPLQDRDELLQRCRIWRCNRWCFRCRYIVLQCYRL